MKRRYPHVVISGLICERRRRTPTHAQPLTLCLALRPTEHDDRRSIRLLGRPGPAAGTRLSSAGVEVRLQPAHGSGPSSSETRPRRSHRPRPWLCRPATLALGLQPAAYPPHRHLFLSLPISSDGGLQEYATGCAATYCYPPEDIGWWQTTHSRQCWCQLPQATVFVPKSQPRSSLHKFCVSLSDPKKFVIVLEQRCVICAAM